MAQDDKTNEPQDIVQRWFDWIVAVSADMDEPEWSPGGRGTLEREKERLLAALSTQTRRE